MDAAQAKVPKATVAEAASPFGDSALPVGWFEAKDPASGLSYYYNPSTGERTWEKPAQEKAAPKPEEPATHTPLAAASAVPEKAAATNEANPATQQVNGSTKEEQTPAGELKGGLPPGWSKGTDPSSGCTYYFNATIGVTQWDCPTSDTPPASAPEDGGAEGEKEKEDASRSGLPPGWAQAVDEATGCPFYFNDDTGETQWHPPVETFLSAAGTAGIGAAGTGGGADIADGKGGTGASSGHGGGVRGVRGRERGPAQPHARSGAGGGASDPMDPSSYSDAPKGGWGAGLAAASRNA